MKRTVFLILLSALFLLAAAPKALAQEPQEPDIDQVINNQIENLTRLFKLDEVQIFFVDSVLQYNYPAMMEEFNQTRKTGASNSDTYQAVTDKWMAATDDAFMKIFTEEQWQKYMKSSYGKEKKRREKRMQERAPAR